MARVLRFNSTDRSNRRAFTLVEVVVVVLILGILAGVAIPAIINNRNEAAIVASISDVQAIKEAARNYRARNGSWPALTYRSDNPGDFDGYIAWNVFNKQPDLTSWDEYGWVWYPGLFGTEAIIFTRDIPPSWDLWQEIDTRYDDGDLLTGNVFVHVNQYLMFVVEE